MAYTEKYVTNAGAGAADGSSLANAWSWATMLTTLAAGQRANVSGAITRTTSSDAFTNAGTAASPMSIRGINSTLGDLEANGRTRGGALVTTSFPVVTYTTGKLTTPTFMVAEHMSFTSAATTATVIQSANSIARRCVFANTHASSATAIAFTFPGGTSIADDCDFSIASSSSSTAAITGAGGVLFRSLITGNTSGAGCIKTTGAFNIIACMLRDAGFGITTTVNYQAYNCSFRNITNVYNEVSSGNGSIRLCNCAGWGTAGTSTWYSSTTSARALHSITNAIGNFNATYTNAGDWVQYTDVTLSADPFTSSTDLTLNSTSGGGTACKAAGYPLYGDLGAWQTQAAASTRSPFGFIG